MAGNKVNRAAVKTKLQSAESIMGQIFYNDLTAVSNSVASLNKAWTPGSQSTPLSQVYKTFYEALETLGNELGKNVPEAEVAIVNAANSTGTADGELTIDAGFIERNRTYTSPNELFVSGMDDAGFNDISEPLSAIDDLNGKVNALNNTFNQLIEVFQSIWSENELVAGAAHQAAAAVRTAADTFNSSVKAAGNNITVAANNSMSKFTKDVDDITQFSQLISSGLSNIGIDVVGQTQNASDAVDAYVNY